MPPEDAGSEASVDAVADADVEARMRAESIDDGVDILDHHDDALRGIRLAASAGGAEPARHRQRAVETPRHGLGERPGSRKRLVRRWIEAGEG